MLLPQLISHLILGGSLVCFSLWLQWTESKGWPNESYDSESDASYLQGRMRSRRRVNVIIAICGVLIVIAGFAGPRLFMLAWLSVTLALLTVIALAALDVLRTQRYLSKKLPEVRRRMIDGDD